MHQQSALLWVEGIDRMSEINVVTCVPSEKEQRTKESVLAEYTEAGTYLRHYSNLRFAILPIYFAVVGALGAVATGIANAHTQTVDIPRWAAGGAAAVTLLFFNFERVCERYLKYFRQCQIDLEPMLGYSAVTNRPHNYGFIWASTWVFYCISFLFWLFATVRGL